MLAAVFDSKDVHPHPLQGMIIPTRQGMIFSNWQFFLQNFNTFLIHKKPIIIPVVNFSGEGLHTLAWGGEPCCLPTSLDRDCIPLPMLIFAVNPVICPSPTSRPFPSCSPKEFHNPRGVHNIDDNKVTQLFIIFTFSLQTESDKDLALPSKDYKLPTPIVTSKANKTSIGQSHWKPIIMSKPRQAPKLFLDRKATILPNQILFGRIDQSDFIRKTWPIDLGSAFTTWLK